jgi:hypothetical protein
MPSPPCDFAASARPVSDRTTGLPASREPTGTDPVRAAGSRFALLHPARVHRTRRGQQAPRGAPEDDVGKYVIGWLLGVPISLLVLIYFVSNVAC